MSNTHQSASLPTIAGGLLRQARTVDALLADPAVDLPADDEWMRVVGREFLRGYARALARCI